MNFSFEKEFSGKKFGNKITSLCVTFIIFLAKPSGVPRNFVRGGGSTNSVEDRGQRERGSGGQ
jgi:hypothetical protein